MNKYEKLGVIGEGTFGVVLKCRHKETDEVVAIKKFKEGCEEDEASKKITLREVKLLRALKHENIVELKEAFRRKGVLYLVFEHLEMSVMDLLESKPNGVGPGIVQALTFQLLRALEHCHKHNVIHRDIKPENLLLNSSDYALRLCDFGCARQMKANVPLTDYVATRWYRPPELLLSTTDYGKGVDMWGLGCIVGELTDGQPLFAGKSDIDQLCVIQKILGPLTSQQMERCLELSDFKGMNFPDGTPLATLQKKYIGKMPEHHMGLVTSILIMDPEKRLTAKAALRLPCFKSESGREKDKEKEAARAVHSEKPMPEQPQKKILSPSAFSNSENQSPTNARLPDLGGMPAMKAARHMSSSDSPRESPPSSQMPPLSQALAARAAALPSNGAGGGLPSIGGAAAAPGVGANEDPFAQAKRHKLPKDSFGAKKDFRNAQQEDFGFKRELRTPLEDTPLACDDAFTNFLMDNIDAPVPEAGPRRSTPQVVDYKLPWENSVPPEELGMAEFTRTPTPIFGSGTQKGFAAEPQNTGGGLAALSTVPGAKKTSGAPAAVAISFRNLGMRESRWSGA